MEQKKGLAYILETCKLAPEASIRDVFYKVTEEFAELSAEIGISEGVVPPEKGGDDGIFGEAIDLLNATMHIIFLSSPNMSIERIDDKIKEKVDKWRRVKGIGAPTHPLTLDEFSLNDWVMSKCTVDDLRTADKEGLSFLHTRIRMKVEPSSDDEMSVVKITIYNDLEDEDRGLTHEFSCLNVWSVKDLKVTYMVDMTKGFNRSSYPIHLRIDQIPNIIIPIGMISHTIASVCCAGSHRFDIRNGYFENEVCSEYIDLLFEDVKSGNDGYLKGDDMAWGLHLDKQLSSRNGASIIYPTVLEQIIKGECDYATSRLVLVTSASVESMNKKNYANYSDRLNKF